MKKKKTFPYANKEIERANVQEEAKTLFRGIPTIGILQTIEMMINVLNDRGVEVRDFDNKEKIVQQVRMVGLKAYFLSETQEGSIKKYMSELQHEREKNQFLNQRCSMLLEENRKLKKKESEGLMSWNR